MKGHLISAAQRACRILIRKDKGIRVWTRSSQPFNAKTFYCVGRTDRFCVGIFLVLFFCQALTVKDDLRL